MAIKKAHILLAVVLLSCSSTKDIYSNKNHYTFTVNFMGQYFEENEVSLSINDKIIFDKKSFGKIPYPQTRGIHDLSVGFKDERVDIMKRYNVSESLPLKIDNIENIRVKVNVDSITESFILDARKGKHYYLKYDSINHIQLKQLKW